MEDARLREGPRAANRSTVVAKREQEGVRVFLSIYRGLAGCNTRCPSLSRTRDSAPDTQPNKSHTRLPPFPGLARPRGFALVHRREGRGTGERGRGLGVTRRSEPVKGDDSTNDCHQRTCMPCVCCVRLCALHPRCFNGAPRRTEQVVRWQHRIARPSLWVTAKPMGLDRRHERFETKQSSCLRGAPDKPLTHP